MSKYLLFLSLFLYILYSCSDTLSGSGTEEGNTSAIITVTDSTGQKVTSRKVYLASSQYTVHDPEHFIDSAFTDNNGTVQFDSLVKGTYRISVEVQNGTGFMGDTIQIETSVSEDITIKRTGILEISKLPIAKTYHIQGTGFTLSTTKSDTICTWELPASTVNTILNSKGNIIESALVIKEDIKVTVIDKPSAAFLFEGEWDKTSNEQILFDAMKEISQLTPINVDTLSKVSIAAYDALYISHTVSKEKLSSYITKETPHPIMVGNSGLYAYFGIVDTSSGSYEGTLDVPSTMLVRIAHPLFFLIEPPVQVSSSITHEYIGKSNWGKTYNSGDRIAVSTVYNDRALLFAYNKGISAGSFTIPAKRLGVFAGDMYPSENGLKIIQGGLLWCAGEL